MAEANGQKSEAERLRAQGNLRLTVMSDAELWELARLLSHPPTRSVRSIYEELREIIEDRKRTAGDWIEALTVKPTEFISKN